MDYLDFIKAKTAFAKCKGIPIKDDEVHPILKPHQAEIVRWMVRGGQRACFARFGLGKSLIQLETCRIILSHVGGRGLIVCPLGVRQEFIRDAKMIGMSPKFIRTTKEIDGDGLYLTNYESVRCQKLDPSGFNVVSLDEAALFRSMGASVTFREFMKTFEGTSTYRFVATATPDPNEFIELLAYAAFLGIMDVSHGKTQWFKRDSTKADNLTLLPHKEEDFWRWVSTWAVFLQKPSDLGPGFSDEGYSLPPLEVVWHELPTDHSQAVPDKTGQRTMFKDTAVGLAQAAREKKDSMPARIVKMKEIVDAAPDDHFIIWHDLEAERKKIKKAIPEAVEIYGTQNLEIREQNTIDFADGKTRILATKASLSGVGCNLQRHCHRAIFLGINYKFHDILQALHRIHRFLQDHTVKIEFIFTEAEHSVREALIRRWKNHDEQVERMSRIIREHGLASISNQQNTRATTVERQEASGSRFTLVNNDSVLEAAEMESDSAGLILTSIPFAFQYEYTPSLFDMGHTEDNVHFWRQMDYLTPNLIRVLSPGRILAIHVKDRIVPGGINKLGFQTLHPFHAEAIYHYQKHGFAFLGMKTIVTDVVRENNQTYRLGWTEQCKDGSRMGCGVPEYLLLFRKPPTDRSNGYADVPVVKNKPDTEYPDGRTGPYDYEGGKIIPGTGYSRSRWQLDACGFTRVSGNRLLTKDDMEKLPHEKIYKLWKQWNLNTIYDFEEHNRLGEEMEREKRLPATFAIMPPHSWHPDVWTDIARMRTMNMEQERRGQEMHLCLAKGTLVLTRGDGYRPIETVAIGDEVLTHKGRWRKVLVSQSTGIRPVVTIKAQGVPGLTLTPDHKLWMRIVGENTDQKQHARKYARKHDPEWVAADKSVGGYVNFKLPEAETTDMGNFCLWWIVGRWLADGHYDGRGGAVISCGRRKLTEFMNEVGEFGGNPAHRSGDNCFQILLRDPDRKLRNILDRCGRLAHGKQIPPEAFCLPKEQAGALLNGYLSGDGHYREDRQRWMATSVSKQLLLGLAALAQRVFSTIACVYQGREAGESVIEGRKVNTKKEWILSFDMPSRERKNKLPFILDDGSWKKVRSCKLAGKTETWNLRVEEDESYTAEGCIVKNCPMQFDIVERVINQMTNPDDLVFDPFAGLGTVPYVAIKMGRRGMGCELSPTYWKDSVRYCRLAEQEAKVASLFDLLDATEEPEKVDFETPIYSGD